MAHRGSTHREVRQKQHTSRFMESCRGAACQVPLLSLRKRLSIKGVPVSRVQYRGSRRVVACQVTNILSRKRVSMQSVIKVRVLCRGEPSRNCVSSARHIVSEAYVCARYISATLAVSKKAVVGLRVKGPSYHRGNVCLYQICSH